MEIDSQKPKEWVGITNEPNYKFTIAHVCVLLLKGLVHLPCMLAHVSFCFTLPYHVCFALPLPHFCFALPLTMPILPAFGCPW
jgi:hypothetical protein